mgnify:CR=1 FL=1
MEDNQIIELYWQRSESAITETSNKYSRLLVSIALNILGNRLDAEECTNDTYLALWNAIPPVSPDPLAPYVYRTGRNMALKRLGYLSAEKRNNFPAIHPLQNNKIGQKVAKSTVFCSMRYLIIDKTFDIIRVYKPQCKK